VHGQQHQYRENDILVHLIIMISRVKHANIVHFKETMHKFNKKSAARSTNTQGRPWQESSTLLIRQRRHSSEQRRYKHQFTSGFNPKRSKPFLLTSLPSRLW
jgi:hypothetical protein